MEIWLESLAGELGFDCGEWKVGGMKKHLFSCFLYKFGKPIGDYCLANSLYKG